jgi:hypothetical protein
MKINKKISIIIVVFVFALISYILLNFVMNQQALEGSLPPRQNVIKK